MSRMQKNASVRRRVLIVRVATLLLFVLAVTTINCHLPLRAGEREVLWVGTPPATPGTADIDRVEEGQIRGGKEQTEELLWADKPAGPDQPSIPHTPSGTISLDVRDADLLDVLTLIAYKLDANIIFLGPTDRITLKTRSLTPLTTLQVVLQKQGLDYLTVGSNFIVGERSRLYGDFSNRMLLTRFDLFYVSAMEMQGFLAQLRVPVESLTVDSNNRALWVQGTPMALGKAREVVSALDVLENAAYGQGGERHIRMPVAIATGGQAEDELFALIDLLSILLDGYRDNLAGEGWGTWDHPSPVPRIYMDWDSPVIEPFDIKMKVTPDLDPNPARRLHYLIAEANPDNINLMRQMIETIRDTRQTPFSFTGTALPPGAEENNDSEAENTTSSGENSGDSSDDNNGSGDNGGTGGGGDNAPAAGSTTSAASTAPSGRRDHRVTLSAVPGQGGSLEGSGHFPWGELISVRADAAEGFTFVRWIESGLEVSTDPVYAFFLYADRHLEAVFSRVQAGTEEDGED